MIKQYVPSLPISLYIHVPFCHSRCDYCGFYSTIYNKENCDRYFSLLKRELIEVVEDLKRSFETIYFGGGNPIFLGIDRIKELILIASKYGKSKEVTIEINPEDVTKDIVDLFPSVNRISTGIQSMKDSTLSLLNRKTRVDDNYKALDILSSSPFIWNCDLITAVPGTNPSDTLKDIEIVTTFKPHHLSLYCLTFEENTPLIRRLSPLSSDKEALFLLSGWQKLRENGYRHYEVSSFCREGYECKHNMVYWTLGQYIGLGPSSEGFLGYTEGVSMRNEENLEDFLNKRDFNCEILNRIETEESYLITILRTIYGVNKMEYKKRFKEDFDIKYGERISLLERKWFINNETSFSLTEEGMMMLDTVILTLSFAI